MPQANPSGGDNSERLENVTFPQARININDNLEALQTLNSGNSEPSVKAAYMPWVDTNSSPPLFKIRNASNDGWITIGTLDPTNFKVGGVSQIANGGTGQTDANDAFNALAPSQTNHSGKFLTTNGSTTTWASTGSSARVLLLTSSQTYTPNTGSSAWVVHCMGGGGGSGSALSNLDDSSKWGKSGGGGSGGMGWRAYNATEMGANAVVTVGAGGAAGSNGGAGGSGGTTSFNPAGTGVTLEGYGGAGSGSAGQNVSSGGGAGGTTNNASFGYKGNTGASGGDNPSSGNANGVATTPVPWDISSNGGGGAGKTGVGSSSYTNGNAGQGGICIIYEW